MPAPSAVILAAGAGVRLSDVSDVPKSLVEIGGATLLDHSVRALRARGVDRIVLVIGYQAERMRAAAAGLPVEIVEDRRFPAGGSLGSLASGLSVLAGPVLVVEGDLLYDPAALDALAAHPAPSVMLASGPTGAGDEIWLEADAEGRLCGMSRDRGALGRVVGELVGITRLSAELAAAVVDGESRPRGVADRPRSYELVGLLALADRHPIAVHVLPDLIWGEVDDASQLRRLRDHVWPALADRLVYGARP